jgi:hypothetical protein
MNKEKRKKTLKSEPGTLLTRRLISSFDLSNGDCEVSLVRF